METMAVVLPMRAFIRKRQEIHFINYFACNVINKYEK